MSLSRSRYFVSILILQFFVVACLEEDSALQQSGSSKQVSVVDDFGRKVELPRSAERIIALSPHITENLFSAGLGERIVATVDYADYPPAALDIPRVGGFADFSVESILSFKPDLVVGWGSGYAGFPELLAKLEALNINVYVSEPTNLAKIADSVKHLAILGGTWGRDTSPVQQRVIDFLQGGETLRATYAANPVRPKVFYQIWNDPLQTLGGGHLVSHLIELCGGQNIFADSDLIAPQVNIETIVDRNPDLIVFTAMDKQVDAITQFWQRWSTINAVDEQRLFRANSDWLSRRTMRSLKGAEQLCQFIDSARNA